VNLVDSRRRRPPHRSHVRQARARGQPTRVVGPWRAAGSLPKWIRRAARPCSARVVSTWAVPIKGHHPLALESVWLNFVWAAGGGVLDSARLIADNNNQQPPLEAAAEARQVERAPAPLWGPVDHFDLCARLLACAPANSES
jgi:hypothetical protein